MKKWNRLLITLCLPALFMLAPMARAHIVEPTDVNNLLSLNSLPEIGTYIAQQMAYIKCSEYPRREVELRNVDFAKLQSHLASLDFRGVPSPTKRSANSVTYICSDRNFQNFISELERSPVPKSPDIKKA